MIKQALVYIGLIGLFLVGSIYAPIEYERDQRAADLAQKRRLVNHFPDPAIAQMTVPAQHKQD